MQKIYNLLLICFLSFVNVALGSEFPYNPLASITAPLDLIGYSAECVSKKGHELKLRMVGHFNKMLAKLSQQEKNELLSYYATKYFVCLYSNDISSSKKYSDKILKKYLDRIMVLIESGANPNILVRVPGQSEYAELLWSFIGANDIEMTQFLFNHGAEPKKYDLIESCFCAVQTKEMAQLLYNAKRDKCIDYLSDLRLPGERLVFFLDAYNGNPAELAQAILVETEKKVEYFYPKGEVPSLLEEKRAYLESYLNKRAEHA